MLVKLIKLTLFLQLISLAFIIQFARDFNPYSETYGLGTLGFIFLGSLVVFLLNIALLVTYFFRARKHKTKPNKFIKYSFVALIIVAIIYAIFYAFEIHLAYTSGPSCSSTSSPLECAYPV